MWLTLLKKSVFNRKMLLVVFLGTTMMLLTFFYQGYMKPGQFKLNMDLLSAYTIPFAASSFVIFCGIFPAIPYAYSYIEERSSGYLKFIQLRMSRKTYAFQKIFFTGLSGGASMLFMGILIFAWIDWIALDVSPENIQSVFETLMWKPVIYLWGGRVVFALKCILLFLFGVLWSELALMISLIFKNRYVAFVLPFLIYELSWILIPVHLLNPVFLVRSDFDAQTPLWLPYLIDIVYIAVVVGINILLFWRQKKQ